MARNPVASTNPPRPDGGLTLGGPVRQTGARGTTGPVTPGWKARGLAVWRRTKKSRAKMGDGIKVPKPKRRSLPPVPKPDNQDWLDVLGEREVDRIVGRQAYQKYHPAFAEIARQKRDSDARAKRNDQWFEQYRQMIGEAAKSSAQIYGGAYNAMSGAASGLQNTANQAALQSQQAAMQDAANRGVAYSNAGDQQAIQAAGNRAGIGQSFADLIAAQGLVNTRGLNDRNAVVVPLQQWEARQSELGKKRDLEAKAIDLQREKGDYRVSLKDQKRENERKFLLEKSAFGLKSRQQQLEEEAAALKAKADAAKSAEERRRWEAEYRLKVAELNRKRAKDAQPRGGSGGGSGGSGKGAKPAKPSQAYYKAFRNFNQAVREYAKGDSDFKVAQRLRKQGVSDAVIKAAHDYARTGRVNGTHARLFLDSYGAPLPMRYRDGSARAPYPTNPFA